MQIPARSPSMTAMTAATLDALSGGRFRLGLGISGPAVSEGWHGVRFDDRRWPAPGSTWRSFGPPCAAAGRCGTRGGTTSCRYRTDPAGR